MARSDINQEFNTFVGGILTEANPINYPAGFTLDEENFILERNGTRRRRLALDVEQNFVDTTLRYKTNPLRQSNGGRLLRWQDDKIVIFLQGQLSSFDIDTGTISSSETVIPYTASDNTDSLSIYRDYLILARDGVDYSTTALDGTVVNITDAQGIEVIGTDTVSLGERRLIIRDFIGVPDSEGTTRPATLSNEHLYNLLNGGWSKTNIDQFFIDNAVYPTVYDNMNTGLDAATGAFTSQWVIDANTGTTQIPKGRFTVDAMEPSTSREGNLFETVGVLAGSLDQGEVGSGEIETAVEYAGRHFFGCNMTSTAQFGTTLICYSPVTATPDNINLCFQQNDPTARDFNQGLATDGGFIDVSEVGTLYRILPVKDRLFIFSSKGVYELFSPNNIFDPVSLSLRKVTDAVPTTDEFVPTQLDKCLHIVVANDTIVYWARGGIYRLDYDGNSATYKATNISSSKIQTLFNNIPHGKQVSASGLYVPRDQTIRWSFADNAVFFQTEWNNKELVYDLVLDAWYLARYADNTSIGNSYLFSFLANDIDIQSDYPIDDSIRYVFVEPDSGNPISTPLRFCLAVDSFIDLQTDGVNYSSTAFLQTGYINIGDSQRFKQSNYVVPSFIRTEDGFIDDGGGNLSPTHPSSCIMTAYWDYADDEESGKINPPQEVYRYNRNYTPDGPSDPFNYGQSVITTKNRLTGRGRALSLRFESSPEKDCRLLGWGMDLGINRKV